jgi:TP901 family phage tail tape measure protein
VRDSLLTMGRDLPIKSITELTGSMKDLITGGYNLQDSLKLTEVAAKGAVAGYTDTSTALGALKNIMGAYSMDVSESIKVQDLLFKSVQLTGANYGDLATSIAGAIPGVAAMGIGFEDFLSSVTVLSEMNVPVGTSIGIMEQAAKQLTLVLGESYMQTNSITDGMMAVYEKSNGELEKILKIVGKPELAKAILMIGQNADSVQDSLIEMGLAAGTAEKAFESSAGTTDNMIQTIHNNLNDIKETIVTNLLPAINAIVKVVKNILEWVGNLPGIFKTFISSIGMVTIIN